MNDDQQDPKVIGSEPIETTKLENEQNVAAVQLSAKQKKELQLMDVKVSSPFATYYENVAFSISAENPSGPFDILPGHHNFISLLTPCTMVVRDRDAKEQKIEISGGIMHVKADRVIVFLDV
jgi:hypothetical protein